MNRFLLTLLSFFVGISTLIAKPDEMFDLYQTLGTEHRLSKSNVTDVLLDRNGNLWIGTTHGLNKYASGKMKHYYFNDATPTTLQSNKILFIVEDSDAHIWVGTNSGMVKYDEKKDYFIRQTFNGVKNARVCSAITHENGLYAAGVNGMLNLYKYDKKANTWIQLYQDSNVRSNTAELTLSGPDEFFINTKHHGIYTYDLVKGQCRSMDIPFNDSCPDIFRDSNGDLWLSVYEKGLYVYRKGRLLHHFTKENSTLSNNIIRDIQENNNTIWFATDGGGVCCYRMKTGKIEAYQHDYTNSNSFPANSTQRLFIQENGNILVCTVRNGLVSMKEVPAISYSETYYDTNYGLSDKNVLNIIEDRDGMVWIGTDGGGLNRFDPSTRTFMHYKSTKGMKITSVNDYSEKELLFYAFNEGPYFFDKKTGEVHLIKKLEIPIKRVGISVLFIDYDDENLLINASELLIFNKKTKEYHKIVDNVHQAATPTAISPDGNIYVVNKHNVISEYDKRTGTLREMTFKSDINDIYHDGKRLWVASSEGLKYTGKFAESVTDVETPLFKEAFSLTSGQNGRIWVGTSKALFVYSPDENVFYKLEHTDGVTTNEFSPNSKCLLSNGYLMIGGINGLSYIQSDIEFGEKDNYEILKQDIRYNGEILNYDSEYLKDSKISLPWNFNDLQTEVTLRNGEPLSDDLFKFEVRKQDKTVYESIDQSSLRLNNFPPGEYTIRCSYYRKDGKWSEPQNLYQLKIYPPWWKKAWFILLVIFSISATIMLASMYILRKKKIKHEIAIAELKNKYSEEKITLMTNISHELRTPLTLVCAPLKRLLKNEIPEEKIRPTLQTVYRHAHHMKSIIDMVLDVRKFDEGLTSLYLLDSDINVWLREVTEKFTPEFEYKGILLEIKEGEHLPHVQFDRNKCEFVISNFIMNALKFSEPGSKTTIGSKLSADGQYVRVYVSDEGIGLKLVDLDHLFDNFYQGEHDKGGSGIGLSYAKTLIGYHQGRIGACENEEGGATFWFELPISVGQQESIDLGQAEEEAALSEEELALLKDYAVLIVEDNTELRTYLKEVMSEYFKKVHVATNGKEGYGMIVSVHPDIIVSDLMMPQMNGFELCKKVKTDINISHIPFVLLTAYNNTKTQNVGYKTGADVFLGKPFEIESLLSVIYNQLKMRKELKARINDMPGKLAIEKLCFSNADENFLRKAEEIIEDSIGDPQLNVDYLADHLCMSRSLLFSKMKAISGVTPVDYITKIRIEHACDLLLISDRTIAEIAEKVGYKTPAYFTSVFKKTVGCSPSEYKKSHKEPR